MNREQVRTLLDKYQKGTLSDKEQALLESWYLDVMANRESTLTDDEVRNNLVRVEKIVSNRTRPRSLYSKYWRAAAAAVLIASSTVWYLGHQQRQMDPVQVQAVATFDVQPGGNKATLTLEDGRTVELLTGQEGIVMGDELTYVDGTTVLDAGNLSTDKEVITENRHYSGYAVLRTPKGGQYQITLSDSSKVWLNAETTLRYPLRFSGNSRAVEVEGEAYFEIRTAKNATGSRIPFVVKSKGQDITVLGTAFNVSAYNDAALTKTTLVNGRVKVAAKAFDEEVLLTPGQEALLSEIALASRKSDVASAVAWKEGKFRFNETTLRDVMDQLSRWYNLEIEYRGDIPKTYFYGVINRNRTLTAVLDVLKESGLNFKIEKTGNTNKLVVLPPIQ